MKGNISWYIYIDFPAQLGFRKSVKNGLNIDQWAFSWLEELEK